MACSNYKSALTNLKKGNIKHFRIRYWRNKKKISSVRSEKEVFFIIDSNNNNFIIDNCIWLKINPKELWENMIEQKDMIKGYGLNIPSFDFNYYIVNYAEL